MSTSMFSIVTNNDLEGYFPGARGLIRQGNPISPYLFLVVTEAFSSLLKWNIRTSSFTFNSKCQMLQISHLAFVDDLFILCGAGADENSFQLIQNTLQEFFYISRLKPNLQKSTILFVGVSKAMKDSLKSILPIPEGHFPI